MHLARCHKLGLFTLSVLAFILFPAFWPTVKLYYFVPFIIIAYYQLSYTGCLWASIGCGTIVDSLSVHAFFGLHAFVYCLTTFFLYPLRTQFFADRPSTLPLMTAIFSLLATLIFMLSAIILEGKQLFSWHLLFTDLLLMPACDGLYAFIYFVLPFLLIKELKRQRRRSY